jgi:twinkle protein
MKTFADYGIDIAPGSRGEVDVLCPQCSHTRKKSRDRCLSVNVDKGTWICHHPHCAWKGKLKGDRTEMPYGAPLQHTTRVYSPPRVLPSVSVPDVWAKMVSWFAERVIPEDVLTRNHITVAKEFCQACDKERSTVLFPYYRNGVHINTKHRCAAKHFRMEKDAERILYGLDDLHANIDKIIIVEGEIDKLSLEVAGFHNCLSVPDGAPAPNASSYTTKFDFLDSVEPLFREAKQVIIGVDADDAGEHLADELARRIGPGKCARVIWPLGLKDANDVLVQASAEEVARCIRDAIPYPVEGIVTGEDLYWPVITLYNRGPDYGPRMGYQKFDDYYRPRLGLVTILTGIPSHGKSRFLDQIMVKLASNHEWGFGICSPENLPMEDHYRRLMSLHVGKPFFGRHDGLGAPRMTEEELEGAQRWARERFTFILPEEPTIDSILDRAATMVFRKGIKGLIIDPWNEIDHRRPQGMNESEYISHALTLIRRFARNHHIHAWVVAHPSKPQMLDDQENSPVGLWAISGSAHWRNKADFGLSVQRDLQDRDAPVKVHVLKVRFGETGELGTAEFSFDPLTGSYHELVGSAYDM